MKNKGLKALVIGLIAVLVMSLGAAAVFAQEDPPADETPAVPAVPFRGFGGHHGFGGDDDEALAEALGITVDELQAARQRAAAARLAQAVEDGLLTQEQANTMLAMQALKDYIDHEAIMAEALGISVDELQAAREDGSLRDLLSNITPAELQADLQAATEAAIQQAVTDNVITQEQADLVLEQIGSGIGLFGGFGGHHGFGGRGGGFRGFGPGAQPDAGESPASFGSASGA